MGVCTQVGKLCGAPSSFAQCVRPISMFSGMLGEERSIVTESS